MELDLPLIWAGIIGLAVILYVVLDGFDLGCGILFPFAKEERDRDQMMNSVAPFWDGNETWLILGGGGLWVAFPAAYAIIMPALYVPVIVMLLALIFRGVAFEFRWVAKPNHQAWDLAFWLGSTVAAFAQGVILGGMLHGIRTEDNAFAGGAFDWLSPFAIMCGLGVVAGYALLGATWLHMRVSGPLERRSADWARPLLLAMLAFILVVSVWTPLQYDRIAERWFSWPNLLYLSPVPVLTVVLAAVIWVGLDRRNAAAPFLGSVGLFILSFAGLAISNFPYLVPPDITIWDAAAAPASQMFLLVAVVILLPVVLGYTVFVYYTFRGRIGPGEGYH
ncbi:cytochrome d ubiquinol oxidase subunit II [Chthonobacter rhizosphaerae]|uniref:cytochrome d ubiquinol oxidase subunit II n=1 Tax=Chthonobacter rhizosphaerae TaxID=2735553 RepID=UPI0015EF1EA8|nr:cytochrome d ubiquinol oxidase subunit II [Chthonobacter rhizosphaerae]